MFSALNVDAVAAQLLIGNEALTMNSTPRGPSRLPAEALERHVCILGTTGSGKSTTAAVLCLELERLGFPVVILDRVGEYPKLLSKSNPTVLNPGENLMAVPFERAFCCSLD